MITKLKNFLSPEQCEELTLYVLTSCKFKEVADDRKIHWMHKQDAEDVFKMLTKLANRFGPIHGIKETLTMYELQVACYTAPGDSYKGLHRDTVPSTPRSHLRKLSMSIEISGDYEGPGVNFKILPNFKADTGDAILFNSWEWHAPAPVIRGERISIIAWFYDEDSDFTTYPVSWASGIAKRKKSRVPADIKAAFKSIGKPVPENLHL